MTQTPAATPRYPTVPDQPDLPSSEPRVLKFWRERRIFERSLEQTQAGPRWTMYEGPPTANGKPGVHHVLARAFKDLYSRYRTMRGYYVRRKAGWDTHGLPVEHEVEKEIGIFDKSRLEAEVGIAEFTRRCRESVYRYVDDWNRLTERMAYWVDLEHPYFTLTNGYMESVWALIKRLWDRGLVVQDYKSVPYDPRIGATLSDHEVAQGYREVDDPSVFVRFRLADDPRTSFLAWTTTPWTLPGNMALAVHPDVRYCIVEHGDERLIVAEPLLEKVVPGEDVRLVERRWGRDFAGVRYQPLYDYVNSDKDRYYVVAEPWVTTEDGTGVVHIAPAFGAEDLAVGKTRDLPLYHSVDLGGHVLPEVTVAAGMFFKDADKPIIADLERRGLMFRRETYRHTYPFGWRTGDPLMYYAKSAWFIRTTSFKQRMLELNRSIDWVPENIRDGRFGNWLENNVDWALSRERFWGTPLPIWTDGIDYRCVGSIGELASLAGRDLSSLDMHRPSIDEVTFRIDGRDYRRVPEVMDTWFDSGSMPYAQWHYPFENEDIFAESFPADFISEGVDQTRGWFYSLHAIATMLFDSVAYRHVVCLGLIVDAAGEKMSKTKGNIIDPYDIFDAVGADALRWYMFASSPPGMPKRVAVDLVRDGSRALVTTAWNTLKFYTLYANADGIGVPDDVAPATRSDMDRWALGRLGETIDEMTASLDAYDAQRAARSLESFVDDLSNWYVRLSRDRFYGASLTPDKRSAHRTLYECLRAVAALAAPFAPFFAELVWGQLVRPVETDAPESVHLAPWPTARAVHDRRLVDDMRVAQRVVDLGRQARASAKLKTRQPLRSALVRARASDDERALARFRALVLDELNVKDVQIVGLDAPFIEYTVRPNLPRLGKRLGKQTAALRAALAAADARAIATAAAAGKPFEVAADGATFTLEPEDVLVDSTSAQGYAFAEGDGMLVALDVRIDDELRLEGIARDIVRAVQDTRKQAGLDVADRIKLRVEGGDAQTAALRRFGDYVAEQTLAVEVNKSGFKPEFTTERDGLKISLARDVVGPA